MKFPTLCNYILLLIWNPIHETWNYLIIFVITFCPLFNTLLKPCLNFMVNNVDHAIFWMAPSHLMKRISQKTWTVHHRFNWSRVTSILKYILQFQFIEIEFGWFKHALQNNISVTNLPFAPIVMTTWIQNMGMNNYIIMSRLINFSVKTLFILDRLN